MADWLEYATVYWRWTNTARQSPATSVNVSLSDVAGRLTARSTTFRGTSGGGLSLSLWVDGHKVASGRSAVDAPRVW